MITTFEALSLQRTPIVTFGYIMQVIISLLIVLSLIYFAAKYLLPKLSIAPKGKYVEVIDRIGIEPQVSTTIIKIGKFYYILGISNKNITLLDKMREEDLS